MPKDQSSNRPPSGRPSASAQPLDRRFDAGSLAGLRQAVLVAAKAAGLTAERANDVVLTVHELAANAVRHGAGAGRALLRVAGGELYCQVSDAGRSRTGGGSSLASRWPFTPGHGLWLVQRTADRVSVESCSRGSEITAVFGLCPSPAI